MTRVSTELPPLHIYEPAKKKWGVDFKKGVVFTYGDVIHSINPIPKDLMQHELVHVRQHREYEGGPDAWWERYLEDAEFRTSQELEAYREQWKYVQRTVKDRNKAIVYLRHYAQSLSGTMYGEVMTYGEALKAIKG